MKLTLLNLNEFSKIFVLSLLIICWVSANPLINNDYRSIESEIAKIETHIRKARDLLPTNTAGEVYDLLVAGNEHQINHGKKNQNSDKPDLTNKQGFFKTYDSDADRFKDYLNETYNQANQGYKKQNKFAKKNKDNYSLENYASFGHGKDGNKQKSHHDKKASVTKQNDHEGSGTSIESHYVDDGESYLGGGEGEYYSGEDSGQYGESGESQSNADDGYGQYSSGEGNNESRQYSSEDVNGYYSDY